MANTNHPTSNSPPHLEFSQDQLESIRRDNLGHRLLALSKDFERRLLAQYSKSGYDDIRPIHGAVLRNLELSGTLVTSLSDRAGITHRAIAKIIEDLEKLSYVRRESDRNDRRASRIWFSERGLALLQDSSILIEDIVSFYRSELGAELLVSLDNSLKNTIDSLNIVIPATGQQALLGNCQAITKHPVSHNMGRYLAELAKDYANRCVRLMALKKHVGIQIGHTAVLSHLSVRYMTHKALAQAAGISPQAIGKQVRSLEKMGYITVSQDVSDKRVRRVNFNSKGYSFIVDLVSSFKQIKHEYIKQVGADDFENLHVTLQSFIDKLSLRVPAAEYY